MDDGDDEVVFVKSSKPNAALAIAARNAAAAQAQAQAQSQAQSESTEQSTSSHARQESAARSEGEAAPPVSSSSAPPSSGPTSTSPPITSSSSTSSTNPSLASTVTPCLAPQESPRGSISGDGLLTDRGTRRRSTVAKGSSSALPPITCLLDIQVSCRNLSSNSSVVALFEAKGNKSLEYVGHTEGIRHSHHPDFQTHLLIEHRKGTGQKVKFNVYTLPPVHTRVEEKMRIGSAYVYLDEIANNCGLDLLIDLVHGYNAEKDKNNAYLKTHLLIKAKIKEDLPEEERIAKVRESSLSIMSEGRKMRLYDVLFENKPSDYLFFYRPDSELGALYWLEVSALDAHGQPPAMWNWEMAQGKCVRLMDILAIYEGHQTSAFVHHDHPHDPEWTSTAPDRCFSIILADGSIDLEAGTVDERESFMLGIHDILTTQAQRERDLENMFKFVVKCRNLPPKVHDGGLFIALSSRDTSGLPYEVLNKTGWLPSSDTPDFPKAMAVPFISDTQSLKFDLFHNSLNSEDGVGTAIVVYKEIQAHLNQVIMVPLRNMVNPEMDALLQAHKSCMLIECMEADIGEEESEEEYASEEDSDEEAEEYYGNRMKKNRAALEGGKKHMSKDELLASIPPLPAPPAPPSVSSSLFNGYNLDKYAFNTRGCSRKIVFAAKDPSLESSAPSNIYTTSTAKDKNPDTMRIYWCKPGKQVKSLDSSLAIRDITNIYVGKKTRVLQRKDAAKALSEHCCSLECGSRTLDLMADTVETRDSLVADLVNFLLPRSQSFQAYGSCGTGRDAEYQRLLEEYHEAVTSAQAEIDRRLRQAGRGGGSGDGDGDGEGQNSTAMPDLQSAMVLLQKLHDKGMERLGLNPDEEFLPSKKARTHPDIMSSLAALDDIFSELDNRFRKGELGAGGGGGPGGGGRGTGGGTGDGVGPGKGGGGAGNGSGTGAGPGRGGGGTGKGRGRGYGGKGTGGGYGDGEGDGWGSDEDGDEFGAGSGGGSGGGRGGRGRGRGRGHGSGSESASESESEKEPEPEEKKEEEKKEEQKSEDADQKKADSSDDDDDEKAMADIERALAKKDSDPKDPFGTGVPMAPDLNFVVGGAAPPPPPPPSFGGPAPVQQRKLKQLHWDPLQSPDVTNTIFYSLNKDSFSAADTDLDVLFANQIAKNIAKKDDKGSKGVQLVDAKRAYNVEIGISRMKMTNSEIKDAILTLDPAVLTEDLSQILLDRVPTLEELSMLKKYTGTTDALGTVEQFFMMMATIPMCGLRLELHLFAMRFPESANELKKKLKVMFGACKQLTSSSNLKRVLEVVLQVGNYLNAGTRKGNAAGFKLSSLNALQNTKSVDGKMSLLDFVVSHIEKTRESTPPDSSEAAQPIAPPGTPFLADMVILKDAVLYDWSAIMEEHRRMKSSLTKIKTIVTGPPPEPLKDARVPDKFHELMTTFHQKANEEFKLLTKRLKRIIQLEDTLLAYFGEEKSKMNLSSMFQLFTTFINSYENSELNVRAAKKRRAATSAAASTQRSRIRASGGGESNEQSFASMLQGVKLKKGPKHLAGGYQGRKTVGGHTVQPLANPQSEMIGAKSLQIEATTGFD